MARAPASMSGVRTALETLGWVERLQPVGGDADHPAHDDSANACLLLWWACRAAV